MTPKISHSCPGIGKKPKQGDSGLFCPDCGCFARSLGLTPAGKLKPHLYTTAGLMMKTLNGELDAAEALAKRAKAQTPRQRFKAALAALQDQSSAATKLLGNKLSQKRQDNNALKIAQAQMSQCEPETNIIWKFVISGRAGKTMPELTLSDLRPLFSEKLGI